MNEIKVMNNDEIRDFCIKKDLRILELEQELQKKENIIKEVREYIVNNRDSDSFTELTSGKITDIAYCIPAFEDILEILDKGSDKE